MPITFNSTSSLTESGTTTYTINGTNATNWVHDFTFETTAFTSGETGGDFAGWNTVYSYHAVKPLTPEEAAAAEAREAERRRERQEAEERALVLVGNLFEPVGKEIVIPSGLEPGVEYRIPLDRRDLVQVWKNGKRSHGLCIVFKSDDGYPVADLALARALLAETDEPQFLALAHKQA